MNVKFSNRLLSRWKWNSLFTKLLVSFLAMILFLLSFNALSLTFFKTNIQQEIIRYNTLGLDKTVDGYEKHFSLIQNDLLQMSFNETLSAISKKGTPYDYGAVASVLRQIQAMTNNTFLYIQNLLVFMPNQKFTIDKNGTSDTADLFVNNFASPRYDKAFWENQLQIKYAFRVFPADRFQRIDSSGGVNELGDYFPVAAKNYSESNSFMLLALVDSDQMFERFHFSINDSFLILNESGTPLFSRSEGLNWTTPPFPDKEGHVLWDGQYFFYKKGMYTGFTYVNIIPLSDITSQVSRLNVILFSILAAAVLSGIAISIYLSYRFNNPIKQMIEGMKKSGRPPAIQSNIHEWNWIHERMADMAQTNREMSTDLTHKKSLLKQYGYLQGIKSLYPQDSIRDLIETDKPFYLLVFQLTFTGSYRNLTEETQEKASYYMLEFINLNITEHFSDALTVQAEKNQILTLVFGEESPARLLEVLAKLKLVFTRDKEYCQLTAAFNQRLLHVFELGAGYEECSRMLQQRRLTDEVEIVTELIPFEEDTFLFLPAAQERELAANLLAGEAQQAGAIVQRLLKQMEQKEMNATQFKLFGKEVAGQSIKALLAHHFDVSQFMEDSLPYRKIQQSCSFHELERVLMDCIDEACRLIRQKKDLVDPVKEFVLGYIEKHYNEDISLEMAAEQLQRSRSYLSTYLKEKTGMTFTDYLHDLRIRKAKEMLGQKDVRINEVSERIGYQNVNSFIRMFKKICGVTPGEYRRQIFQEGEEEQRP
jgi:AraC-like DNA-binding protein/predicted membrane chloride channel (bestrophin family)